MRFVKKHSILKWKTVKLHKCISPDEAVRRAYVRHTTEGARARNSQVTELIADGTLESCIRSFADIVSEGMNIDKQDYDFVIEFYSNGIIGLIAQWMDLNMQMPKVMTRERLLRVLEDSVENMLARFQNPTN